VAISLLNTLIPIRLYFKKYSEAENRRVVVERAGVVIWAGADGGEFWPVFPIVAWGVGLALHAWSVFGREPTTTYARIGAEAERLRARGAGGS
jgi:hypothetical protein